MAKLVDASNLNFDDYYNRAGSIPALWKRNIKKGILGNKIATL